MAGRCCTSKPSPDRERILALRSAGLTHAQIGEQVGLSRTRIAQILSQARTPEQIAELRARVHAKAEELRNQA
ncbi:sigma factor-like helix-turn-helix DNA-binding protein [Leucobacter sp. NPDC015123]|uniref:sigma factor-like helix-turn-helix DNA-binding protein n=1 Tax=Leucobacter sp. NPDC015123 TaxID=3364129 RepID=UPI0036F48D9A